MGRLFAIGDIHGCFRPFRELVEEVLKLEKEDQLILLGDYIDRGPNSKTVIDYILLLMARDYDIIPLIGNHEHMLLDSIKDRQNLFQWLMNGGPATLIDFGYESPGDMGPPYLEFFRNLKFFHIQDKFYFVHAGFNDKLPDPFTDTFHMVWYCNQKYNHPIFQGKTIIHGHRIIQPQLLAERLNQNPQDIGIDTGCVYGALHGYGYLTAIQLPELRIFSVPNNA